jgi:uncharacterized protein YgiB involved in biofilm formation
MEFKMTNSKRSQNIEISSHLSDIVNRAANLNKPVAIAAALSMTVALSGCGDPEPQTVAFAYQNPQQCVAAQVFTPQTCTKFFNDAKTVHVQTAPRFEKKEDCEAEYGDGKCESVAPAQLSSGGGSSGGGSGTATSSQSSSGGGGFFMPYMMGYMAGSNSAPATSSSGSTAPRSYASAPVYSYAGGGYMTGGGRSIPSEAFSSGSKGFSTATSSLSRPPVAGFQSHSSVVSRGGFGRSGASMSMSS